MTIEDLSKTLEEVKHILRRSRRCSDLEAWQAMEATYRRDLKDCIGQDCEGWFRAAMEFSARKVQTESGFRELSA